MKRISLRTVDEAFADIERLLKRLRRRITDLAEPAYIAAPEPRVGVGLPTPAKRAIGRRH